MIKKFSENRSWVPYLGESAEGPSPSVALRTRREPLDSPGSRCSVVRKTPVSKEP